MRPRINSLPIRCLPWLLSAAVAWSSAACKNESSERIGGETHWVSCKTKSECGAGESCECERCVSGCESDEECSPLGANASCELLENSPLDTSDCATELERICVTSVASGDASSAPEDDDSREDESDADDSDSDDSDSDDSDSDDSDSDDSDSDDSDGELPEVLGRALNAEQGCFVSPASVGETGCVSGSLDELVRTTALDDAGTCWLFSTSCIPPGFTSAPPDGECSPDAGTCESGCDADTFEVNGDCLSCSEVQTDEVEARVDLVKRYSAASCSSDSDCAVASISTSCAPTCNTVIGESAQSEFEADLAALDQTYCGAADAERCPRVQVECEQAIASCVGGVCTNGPSQEQPGMCEQVLSDGECVDCTDALTRHAAALSEVDAREDLKLCQVDDDCTLVTPATECATLCPLIIASESVATAEEAISQLSDDYCDGYASAECPQMIADCAQQVPVCEAGLCGVAGQTQACDARTPDSCEIDGNCRIARAHGYFPSQDCFASGFLDVACREDPGACDEAETPTIDEHGECWLLPDTCLPPGFTSAEGTDCDSEGGYCDEDLCDVKSVDECLDDADCSHFNAFPLDEAEQCYSTDLEPIACTNASGGCTGNVRLAVDLNDRCWVLPAGCMPLGMRDPRNGECPDENTFCE